MGERTLRCARVVTPDGVRAADVVVDGTRIARVTEPGAGPALDLGDAWLLPGFVDVHVHGGGGAQFNTADPAEVRRAAAFHARHGTTALLATTAAAPVGELLTALRAIGDVSGTPGAGEAEVLGAHLEGPFLSRARPGAMDGDAFLDPDPEVAARLLEGGAVRWMTVAPELPGAAALIEEAVARDVVAALGHTDGGYGDALTGIAAGARVLTHAFNAMRSLHHRDPAVIGAALERPELACELICDGVHVDPVVARLLTRLKGPAGTVLVTDAIEAAGLADGEYRLAGRAVAVAGGRATLPETDTIAGSTLTMDAAVRNAVRLCDISVADAAQMAATTPARLLGIADRKGAIAAGRDADLVLLDADLGLTGVLARGAWIVAPDHLDQELSPCPGSASTS